jgi:hypothetical protein
VKRNTALLKLVQVLERTQKRFLRNVLRVIAILQRCVGQPKDRPPLAPKELIKRFLVPTLCPFEQEILTHAPPPCEQERN